MPDNETSEQGVYTKDMIDTITFGDIERAKSTFISIYRELNIDEAIDQLKDLFTLMDSMLYKYYHNNLDKIKNERIELNNQFYNFYEIESFLELQNLDYNKIRKICELNYKIYNVLIKPFISMPTTKTNSKKKLIERLFCLIKNKDDTFYDEFIKGYEEKLKITKLKDNYLNFKSYCFSEMPNYDLDIVNTKVGANRSGKSIETLHEVIRNTTFALNITRKKAIKALCESDFITKRTIFDEEQDWKDLFKISYNKIFFFDEAFSSGADKRDAMTALLKDWSHVISKYAKNNNLSYLLLPNLTYIDGRFIDKSNALDLIYERGSAYSYAIRKNYPIAKDTFGFEYLQKHNNLLSNDISAEHNLKRVNSYIKKLHWSDMSKYSENKFYNPLYKQYKDSKDELEEINKPKNEIIEQKFHKKINEDIYNKLHAEGLV